MAKKREIKTSQDISKLEEQNKNTFYTFGFRYFETDSKLSSEKVFNSNYSSIIHFLKTNSDLISAMKLISSETYKTTIIDNKLKDVMHFKILEREESKNRITEILVEVYVPTVNISYDVYIPVESKIEEVKLLMSEDAMIYTDILDTYEIAYPNVGFDTENNPVDILRIVTVPDTKNIITMYPSGKKTIKPRKKGNVKTKHK